MISLVTFIVAAAMLVAAQVLLWTAKRRGNAFFSARPRESSGWSPRRLWLASFLTLFAEMAFIRWIAVEVRVFAYFKNLALVLCFLGFGVGCALVTQRTRWLAALQSFLALVLMVRIPHRTDGLFENLSQRLGGAGDVSIWETPAYTDWRSFLAAAALSGCLFLLIVSVFVPLGQVVSQQMDRACSSLRAYSWNLFGSVVGIAAFFAVSRLMFPPSVWMGVVLLGFALLQNTRRDAMLVASLVVPLALLLHDAAQPNTQILWTPYQEVLYTRRYTRAGDAWGGILQVNHTFYQSIVNLSPEFLARHPAIQKQADYDPYNLPFRFTVSSPTVLVVGSGTGNDVAAALRHNSRRVDAVEIDPAILELGKREHPERPYDSPKVAVYLGDARNFLKRTNQQYDLILFGLLDSHTQFSDYANMRIDNFVYTEEAFREAVRHLTPNGIIFVKFQVDRPWIANRLIGLLRQAVGSSPVVFRANSTYTASSSCFVASRSDRVEEALAADLPLATLVVENQISPEAGVVPATTDDWPYLYQKNRRIPLAFYSVSILVILTAIVLYIRVRRTQLIDARFSFSLFFFSMGAGFLLLETQIISRLALFFGTIWQVNAIVVTALLLALLLANAVVEKMRAVPKLPMWGGLLASLAIAYWFPFARIPASPTWVGMIAVGVFSVPVVFAGILFSSEFRKALSPSAALCSNVIGAVAGGLLENLSLVFGLRALLLVAFLLYSVAAIGYWQENPRS